MRREDRPRRDEEAREWEPPPPGLAPRPDEPPTPEGLDLKELPRAVRAELRGLTVELADIVGAHLLMAGKLIDSDPELAYRHAEAARRRAARLPVTREAAGEAAYAAGDYAAALTEFRALRRMNGSDEFVAAMADCERALGNPDKALALVKEGLKAGPDFTARVELRLVEAGCRMDLGQSDEALRLLRQELEGGGGRGTRSARIRLRYGYANLLEETGSLEEAERWFGAAAAMDVDGETDAVERVEALQGLVIEIDEDDLVGDEPEPEAEPHEDEPGESVEDAPEESSESAESPESGESPESPQSAESAEETESGQEEPSEEASPSPEWGDEPEPERTDESAGDPSPAPEDQPLEDESR